MQSLPKFDPNAARRHFDSLTEAERVAAIRNMAAMGFGEYALASATGLSVEAVKALLSEKGPAA